MARERKRMSILYSQMSTYIKDSSRQKIYDQFNLKDWSSVPVGREQARFENQFTKKLIINPLGETSVDVPVPYGYTLIPGKYADHRIVEVGPGEFKVQVQSKNPVTIGLSRIKNENHLGTLPKVANPQELGFWPQHLLFTQSLKGLPPLEAAARLEKYIAEEGDFYITPRATRSVKAISQKLIKDSINSSLKCQSRWQWLMSEPSTVTALPGLVVYY